MKIDLNTLVKLWKYPKTGLEKTVLDLLHLTLTLANLWKFPETGLDKTVLELLHWTLTLVNLWKFPKTGRWIKLYSFY